MGKTIEERVVEMRFDNKEFERNSKETMNTLSKLKNALNFSNSSEALKSLDKAANSLSFEGMASGIEALQKRFSTFGIVGMRVIENITDSLMNSLGKSISFVTDSIVSGGIKRAMNIENAHFQLQALLKDEVKVQEVMANAMESVDGTAYAYDEAAKAASQFAASGIQAGDEMLNALKGITGVAAMTNSSFEDISRVFTVVAGNGRLMGDQLLQLSSRGLNAASTLSEYFREVRGQAGMTEAEIREMVSDGKISFKDFSDAMTWAFGDSAKRANETFNGALSNMKSALARIGAGFVSPLVEQNGEVVKLFNALRIQINNVKSALVFDEQTSAISGLSKATNSTTDEMKELFQTIKNNGSVSASNLNLLAEKGVDATDSLTKYINGVTKGSVRATYAITTALNELTGGLEVSREQVSSFIQNGKIDLSIFTAAIEKSYGDQKAASKQFTDFFLDNISAIVKAIESTDLTTAMETFYYILESVKNVLKGIWSVIKPVGQAFSDVFLSFSGKEVINFVSSLEKLTSRLHLSEKGSKNLHDALEGIFNVIKLVLEAALKLLGISTNAIGPMGSLLELFLSIAGAVGRLLTKITDLIRGSKLFQKTFSIIGNIIRGVADAISFLIDHIDDFISYIYKLPITQKAIKATQKAFKNLGEKASPYIQFLVDKLKSLRDWSIKVIPEKAGKMIKAFIDLIIKSVKSLKDIDLSNPSEWLGKIRDKFKSLFEVLNRNEGVRAFTTNVKEFVSNLTEAFTFDNLIKSIETFKDKVGGFGKWLSEKLGPIFEKFSFGDLLAAGSGVAVITTILKISKSLDKITSSFQSIPNLLGGVKGTLVAYQKDLKASAIIKIAGAIAILAGALVLLSFADTERLLKASISLGIVAGVLLFGISKLLEAMNKGRKANDAINVFAKGLSASMQNLTKGVKWASISSIIKSIGITIALIAGSIVALFILYRKDQKAFEMASTAIATIMLSLLIVMGYMSLIGTAFKSGTRSLAKAGAGVLLLSLSLNIILNALKKVFKMDLPSNWQERFVILGILLTELAALTLVIGLSNRIAGKNKISATTFIGISIMLIATISALNKLFKMSIPSDYKEKLSILSSIFKEIALLLISIGIASRLAGGTIKAASTILSISLLIGVIVGALIILSIFPAEKLKKGAEALGIVLLSLAITIFAASKLTSENAYKTVLAMAVSIGAILVALGVLSIIPFDKLIRSASVLSILLLALAVDLKAVSKITSGKALSSIIAMLLVIAEIAGVLVLLTEFPWKGILASATAISEVLIAFGICFKLIGKTKILPGTVNNFLAASVALFSIANAISMVADRPWEGLLAAGNALSEVILAFGYSFKLIANTDIRKGAIENFLVSSLSLLVIALALYPLSEQPWEGLLAAGNALSEVILAFGYSFKLIANTKVKSGTVEGFLTASLSLLVIALALYPLSEQPWEGLLAAASSLSLVLIALSGSLILLSEFNVNSSSAIQAAKALVEFVGIIVGVFGAASLILGGINELIDIGSVIDSGIEILVKLANGIGQFIGGFVNGLISEISNALPTIGENFSLFWSSAQSFFDGIANLKDGTISNMVLLAGALVAFTAAELIAGIASLIGTGMLVGVGVELSGFMNSAKSFFEGLNGISDDTVKSAKNVADMIMSLTVAELIRGIGEFFGMTGSISDFGSELESFGPSIKAFADQVKDVNPESVQGAAAAAKIMSECADNLPGTGGLVQKIFGEKHLSDFAVELLAFAPSIVAFAELVKDVNPESVQGAAEAGSIMAELANNLPGTDGLVQKIFGKKDLSDFGDELEPFGESITQFTEKVKDIDPETVKGAVSVGEMMSALADSLPATDGFAQQIFGEKNLADFGEQLVPFGESIADFADEVKDIKSTAVEGAVSVGTMMAELANKLPDTGGVVGFFTGDQDLEDFSEQLVPFGESIADFADEVKDIDESSVNAATNTAKILGELTGKLSDEYEDLDGLEEFGEELKKFGPYISDFSKSVKGIDPNSAAGAKSVASMMAELANTLPGADGLVEKIFGEKSLADFGEELLTFAPSIKAFADQVKDVDPSAVQGAAAASNIMSECANNLPATGGLAQKLFGEKSLADFGEELIPFGESMKEFSDKVIGISPMSVQGAAMSASMMNELAQKLPSTNGLVQQIFGGYSLSNFGEELKEFAYYIVKFTDAVKDVDTSGVQSSYDAAILMIDLINKLNDDSSILDIFKVGSSSLTSLAMDLSGFSEYFVMFYDALDPVDFLRVDSALYEIDKLIDLAIKVKGLNSGSLINFIKELKVAGETGISLFIESFENSHELTSITISDFFNNAIEAIKKSKNKVNLESRVLGSEICLSAMQGIESGKGFLNMMVVNLFNEIIRISKDIMKPDKFKEFGRKAILGLRIGIDSQKFEAIESSKTISDLIVSTFKIGLSKEILRNIGSESIDSIMQGIVGKQPIILSKVLPVCNEIISVFENTLSKDVFASIGRNIGDGLSLGINSKKQEIKMVSENVSRGIISSVTSILKIHSPSEVGYKIGEFWDEGLANGITKNAGLINKSSIGMSKGLISVMNDSIKGMMNAFDDNIDYSPTIRPVIDLTDINAGAKVINSAFDRRMDVGFIYDKASNAINSRSSSNINNFTVNVDNKSVVDSINSLKEDINSLSKSISNMELRLDTGTLVGEITGPLNRSLGKQSERTKRRV